ncbi:MAG: hypothetical protein WB869_22525, partial [Candidatus Acidiferrales bacterium]
ASANSVGGTRKAKLLRLMNSLLRLPLLGFLYQSSDDFPGPNQRTSKTRRHRSKIPLVESDDGIGATIDGRFQNHLVVRIW